MSFKSLLKHRCSVRSLDEVVQDGASSYVWIVRLTDVKCRIDLQPLASRDPYFTPEGGRPTERAGMMFFLPNEDDACPVKSGDTIVMTKGPKGTFQIENIIDEIWNGHRLHHFEVGVTEVAPQIARKQVSQ